MSNKENGSGEDHSQDPRIAVLLIEDDYFLTTEYVQDFERPDAIDLTWVDTYDEGLAELHSEAHDICLLDYRLGARDGVELLKEVKAAGCRTPIIMLTGAADRAIDRAAMRHGAADYLVKTEITPALLERSIRHTMERHRFTEELRELAAENAHLYREARQAVEMRDEIHRIVVHDLRNPLSTMGLSVQLMERLVEKEGPPQSLTRELETQKLCIQRMNRLVQDLLDVARLDSGGLTLNRTAVNPIHLVESAISQHRIQAEDRDIELTASLAGSFPEVDVDPRRVEQILANLIGNALKFTPAGGTIELSLQQDSGDEVIFTVADTGPGISEEQLPHLFDRFWQAEEGSRHGAGLGLAICKGLVDAHGGRIWVESKEKTGTIFYFSLSTAEASEEAFA